MTYLYEGATVYPDMAKQSHTTPRKCLEPKPTRQTVYFGGAAINLSAIMRVTGLTHAYLSRLFSGRRRNPSAANVRKIATALGMSSDGFMTTLGTITDD